MAPLDVPVGSTNSAPKPPPRRMELTNRQGRFHDLSGIGPQKQSKLTVLQYRHDMATQLRALTVSSRKIAELQRNNRAGYRMSHRQVFELTSALSA